MLILIAGAGRNGRKCAGILAQLGIKVEAFLDNDDRKIGSLIEGIPVVPVSKYSKKKDESIVLFSPDGYISFKAQIEGIYPNVRDINVNVSDKYLIGENVGYEAFYPIGHYESLYPNASELMKGNDQVEDQFIEVSDIPGVDLNEDTQYKMLEEIMTYYKDIPAWKKFRSGGATKYRFRLNNPSFPNGDAVCYFAMLNIVKPQRVIEIGSGWTSAILLDANQYIFNGGISCSFIEPYADRLKSILNNGDNIELYEKDLQEIPLEFFDILNEGDILFIDSTHISKQGSDVNYLFFEVIPRLKKGVYIHIHDIFYPLVYPYQWIKKGFVLNEAFILRAFLQYNHEFEIIYYQNYIQKKYKNTIAESWPLEDKNDIGGGSFWMRRR